MQIAIKMTFEANQNKIKEFLKYCKRHPWWTMFIILLFAGSILLVGFISETGKIAANRFLKETQVTTADRRALERIKNADILKQSQILPQGGNKKENKLAFFSRSYTKAFNAILDIIGREQFPHYGEKIKIILVFKASDGYASFYFPANIFEKYIRSGVFLYDYSSYNLNEVLQTVSLNRIQVLSTNLGAPIQKIPNSPKNVEPINSLDYLFISSEIREAITKGLIKSLPGISIGPEIKVSRGVKKNILPTRLRIWSPLITVPEKRRQRMYSWEYADIWWMPERLELSTSNAKATALQDAKKLLDLVSDNTNLNSLYIAAQHKDNTK